MREFQLLKIDRRTGDAVMTTEVIDDDAGFAQRVTELKDSVPGIGPVEARFLAVACNGCGTQVELDFDDPQMPQGWASGADGDFCPRCQSSN